MQAALQPHVDSAIAKTINVPTGYSFTAFSELYLKAYKLDLKGCTVFRPNEHSSGILESEDQGENLEPRIHRCTSQP